MNQGHFGSNLYSNLLILPYSFNVDLPINSIHQALRNFMWTPDNFRYYILYHLFLYFSMKYMKHFIIIYEKNYKRTSIQHSANKIPDYEYLSIPLCTPLWSCPPPSFLLRGKLLSQMWFIIPLLFILILPHGYGP